MSGVLADKSLMKGELLNVLCCKENKGGGLDR